MNLFGLSPGELLLIMMVAMVVLGPEKLPEVAASLGKWIREFRRATEELTAQFAGENPLYEIQRALSLTDDPVSVTPAVEEASEVAAPYVSPELPAAVDASGMTPQTTRPVQSDYFTYPQMYPSISDLWVHGGLSDVIHRKNGSAATLEIRPIAEEWTFGVPVPRPTPPEPVEEEVSQTHHVDVAEPETASQNGVGTYRADEAVAIPVPASAGDGREGDRT